MNEKENIEMHVSDEFDKTILNKVRRWKVDIRDFKITQNLLKNMKCFFLITIGGNLMVKKYIINYIKNKIKKNLNL